MSAKPPHYQEVPVGHGPPQVYNEQSRKEERSREEGKKIPWYLLLTILAADHCRAAQMSMMSGATMVKSIMCNLRHIANFFASRPWVRSDK